MNYLSLYNWFPRDQTHHRREAIEKKEISTYKHMTTRTRFNDLCHDLLLELLSYFTVEELFYSFSLLIINLEQFLIDYHVRLHLRSPDFLSHINPKQVISLDIPHLYLYMNRFVNLRSITIRDGANNNTYQTIQTLYARLPELSSSIEHVSLIFTCNCYRSPASDIFPLLFSPQAISKWKRFDLSMTHYKICLDDVKNLNTINTTLEHLVYNADCNISAIVKFLSLTPRLKILRAILNPNRNFRSIPVPIHLNLPWLRSIDLIWHHIDFKCIIELIHCAKNLTRCHLKGQGYSDHKEVIKSDIWISLLEQQTRLKWLIVNMAIFGGDKCESMLSQFRQDLFFQKVNFKLESVSTSQWDVGWLNLIGNLER